MVNKNKELDDMIEFGEKLSELVFPYMQNKEGAMMATGMMMKMTMELYTRMLNDGEIHELLQHIFESIPEIRENSSKQQTMH